MLQRGIPLQTLDTAYITSMSFYFLVMFGMRGLYSLVLGSGGVDDMAMMQAQMGMTQQQPGQQPDMGKLYAAEAENMQIVEHVWFLDAAEQRLLKGKTASTASAAAGGGGAAAAAQRKKRQ